MTLDGHEPLRPPAAVDMRLVRQALSLSQREMAGLMGISLRAVQSYEQGWRTAPPSVQKIALLLCRLKRRRPGSAVAPCWTIRDCDPAVRDACPAFQMSAGDLCWLVTGNLVGGQPAPCWEAKLGTCRSCPVMRSHLARVTRPARARPGVVPHQDTL